MKRLKFYNYFNALEGQSWGLGAPGPGEKRIILRKGLIYAICGYWASVFYPKLTNTKKNCNNYPCRANFYCSSRKRTELSISLPVIARILPLDLFKLIGAFMYLSGVILNKNADLKCC